MGFFFMVIRNLVIERAMVLGMDQLHKVVHISKILSGSQLKIGLLLLN